MAILAIVLAPLTTSFANGMVQQASQTRREQAYSSARVALQRMRLDVHCAERRDVRRAERLRRLHGDDDGVERPEPRRLVPRRHPGRGRLVRRSVVHGQRGSTSRFDLYRFLGTNPTDCDGGSSSTFETSYLAAQPGSWPTNSAAVGSPAAVRRRAGSGISGPPRRRARAGTCRRSRSISTSTSIPSTTRTSTTR